MDLQMIVEDHGCEVVGTCATVRGGLELAEDARIDAAILDVRLKDGDVFPLAERLKADGTRIIFHSGHALREEIREAFPNALFCPKPTSAARIVTGLQELFAEPVKA
jgi:DNA-binding NarL/FixJ family response regulator